MKNDIHFITHVQKTFPAKSKRNEFMWRSNEEFRAAFSNVFENAFEFIEQKMSNFVWFFCCRQKVINLTEEENR